MKQIIQSLKTGETTVEDIPKPSAYSGSLGIQTRATLVSAGTERMLVEFGKGNLIQKARSQPDKVKQVLDKIRTDGLLTTLDSVRNKLDAPLALGYCNVGVVHEVGKTVTNFQTGDRVISNGKHAEFVVVPKNLCAKIPDNVDDESASFTVIGAIALQGIRLIEPTLGETVVVSGLGLIGLVAVQLLRANGCKVIGIDFDREKLELARQFGADVVDLSAKEDPIKAAEILTNGSGVDAVLITASTDSNEPIHQAATMCRKRGRIVLVGVVGMQMSRADFYEKELSFQVSCSYGPGRYDISYEDEGHDYPLPYVRWTEQRNFEAILALMASGQLDMKPLVSHQFKLDEAEEAYRVITEEKPLGIVIHYDADQQESESASQVTLPYTPKNSPEAKVNIGFIGAGNYASAVLAPAFSKTRAKLVSIASQSGVSSVHVGKKHGFEQASTDAKSMLTDDTINTLVVATRHNSHASWVVDAIKAGKHIFVEKPLALNRSGLNEIKEAVKAKADSCPAIMVGFNRRFSPYVSAIKHSLSKKKSPCTMLMTVNAGEIPDDHWTQDRAIGGGRIIGEACHFVDLLRHLAGSSILSVNAMAMDSKNKDSVVINLQFANGSVGSIQYLANGTKSFPKERLEVFCDGVIAQIDNFKAIKSYRWPGIQNKSSFKQDKGQSICTAKFVDAIHTGDHSELIPFEELVEVAEACFDIDEQINR